MPITSVSTYFKASIQSTKLRLRISEVPVLLSPGLCTKVGVGGDERKHFSLEHPWLAEMLGEGEFRGGG